MPYKDPAKKRAWGRAWDKAHRSARSEDFFRRRDSEDLYRRVFASESRADPANLTPEGSIASLQDLATIPEERTESLFQQRRRLKLL